MSEWRCPQCGNHYFMHVIRDGRPVCEIMPQYISDDEEPEAVTTQERSEEKK